MVASGNKITRMDKRNAVRKAEKEIRREAVIKSNCRKSDRNIANRKSEFLTGEGVMEDRFKVATDTLKVYTRYLPGILKDLSEIKDPRNLKKKSHKLSMLLLYGIFSFVYHMSSRRDTDSEMTAVFMENMKEFFPEFDRLPHSCTLARLLKDINVMNIEEAAVKLIKRLIKDKKFVNYLINKNYVIVIDGVHKFTREWEWCENSLQKHKKGQPEGVNQYYATVLEASFVLPEGLTIPFMSEFMDRKKYKDEGADTEKQKQDCELKAFKRLADRLKKYFPHLKIALTLDGLYANGPLMDLCQRYGWDYIIVLKDGSLKTVWEDIEGLKKEGLVEKYTAPIKNGVKQEFWWVNNIDYRYGDNKSNKVKINVVVCEESYTCIDSKTGQEVEKTGKFAWISFREITVRNVEKRCNNMGRPRWNIETQNLVEKYHGYAYTHCFSYNWDAMKGYHYLMHLGHIMNILTLYSTDIIERVRNKGARRVIKLIWETFDGNILDVKRLKMEIQGKYQIRLAV